MSLAAFASFALFAAPPQAQPPAPPPADPVTERFDAMQREIEALREKTARQDDQIERLKAENDEKWLTEQRAAQIRGIVGDVLGDSSGRASLRTDGAVAGYDRNFFIASADGNFRLNFEGQLQTRFAFSFLPREAVSGNPPNLGQVQNEYGFELRRVKLNFFGHMFDPSWQYRIQFAYERDGQNVNRPLNFEDVFVQKSLGDGLWFRMGQWKTFFNTENITSSRTLQFAERSLVNQYFMQNFIQGVLLGWEGPALRAYGSYNDGGGNANLAEVQLDGNPTAWATTWRADWKLAGEWGQFKDQQGWRGSPFAAAIGVGVNWQRASGNPPSGRLTVGNGSIAPGVNAPIALLASTVDANLRGDGWSATAAFLGNWAYGGGTNAVAQGVEGARSFGVVVQGGVFVTDALELMARYEGLWVASDRTFASLGSVNALNAQTLNIVTVGASWYFRKNAIKFTTDVGYAFNPVLFSNGLFGESIAGADWRPTQTGQGAGEVVVRAQMQLLF